MNGQKQATAGVKKAQQALLKHHNYVEVLAQESIQYVTQRTIQSIGHRLYTRESRRVGLSSLDFKRYILSNNINTIPFGYY